MNSTFFPVRLTALNVTDTSFFFFQLHLYFFKFKFIYFNWRLITLQYCIDFNDNPVCEIAKDTDTF